MAPKPPTTVARVGDAFEAALKAARVPDPLYDALWDCWVVDPAQAHQLVARFIGQQVGQQVAAKLKQAPLDPVEAAGARFIAALRAKLPDEQAIAYLDQQTQALQGASGGPGKSTLTNAGAQSAVTTKSTGDFLANVLQGDLRTDMIPLD